MNFWRELWGKRNAGQPSEDDFDPDTLLERAQREMNEVHARNRERAVEAITQKNNLQQMVTDLERKVETLEQKAKLAEERGDPAQAALLRKERASYEVSLNTTRASLEHAIATSDQVKRAIKREEDRIRQKTAEALLLRTQWNTMKVQRSLFASLVEINAGTATDVPTAERAVRHARNRRSVRQAFVQRDNLRQMLTDTEKHANQLRENAVQARERGNDDMENALLRELEQYEALVVQTRDAANQADYVTEQAAALLENEENTLRSLGFDPHSVSEDDIALYEAKAALSELENGRKVIRERQRSTYVLTVLAAASVILLIILLLI